MRPRRETDHSSPSSAEVMNGSRVIPPLPNAFTAKRLIKYRDNFTFNLYEFRSTSRDEIVKMFIRAKTFGREVVEKN
jgi:hypothetical protein